MQFTRTIASILALSMALCAMPTRAESEDTPLPGDFQLAPAPRPAKAKPLNLPPVNAAASSEKAAETPQKANLGEKTRHGKSPRTVSEPKPRAGKPAARPRRQSKAKNATAPARRSAQQTQAKRSQRIHAKASQLARSKKATARSQQQVRPASKATIKRHSLKRKKAAITAAHSKKAVKKVKPAKKPSHQVAKTKK